MTEYRPIDRILHHLALKYGFMREMCFDLERQTQKKNLAKDLPSVRNEQHIFVAGLARAGTTILMRSLYESGEFASLTYRDMPFVMMPNLWQRLTGGSQQQIEASERAHGDGILVDFDSPEALEEVFWRTYCGRDYIHKDHLSPHAIDPETLEKFQTYVALVLKKYSKSRYLSKNNNTILRLPAIRTAFPNALILIPFRAPAQHAFSLLKQHQRFCAEHGKDRFSKKYMTWLVHHEFGSDHRPFIWDKSQILTSTPDDINYWLDLWCHTYEALLERVDSSDTKTLFVGYEIMCEDTENAWHALSAHADLKNTEEPSLSLKTVKTPEADSQLLARAEEIYQELQKRCKRNLLD